jgi:hypothetical protein
MKRFCAMGLPALLIGAAAIYAQDRGNAGPVVVTASNAGDNQLLVYDTSARLLQTVSTQGKGGVSGNSGGIAVNGGMVAVVNFGSKNVSIFARQGNGFRMRQMIPAASDPVSVAFGHDHLYILGTTKVESHQIFGARVSTNPDGLITLLKADGSAAQVGVLPRQVIIAEKSNVIETMDLRNDGAVMGAPTAVTDLPAGTDTPFGLVTRGDNAYVTIAHSDQTVLVRNGQVLTVTPSMSQHAPCWAALIGPFLYTANSPSMSVSRYAVYGQKIVQDSAIAALFNGAPTDVASGTDLLAVVDGSGPLSHISVFSVDEDGNLKLNGVATVNAPANGIAVVEAAAGPDE